MTIKQKKFKEGMVAKLKGANNKSNTQIAIDAGYSERTAYSIANENLKKPEIKREIDNRMAEIEAKTDYTVEFVRQEILNLLEDCKIRNDNTNRKGALELLAKHKGMLVDNVKTDNTTRQDLNSNQIQELEQIAREAKLRLVTKTA